ncbi:MAG: ThiF family adenylyltransferase [Patescibacteria group bacterium]
MDRKLKEYRILNYNHDRSSLDVLFNNGAQVIDFFNEQLSELNNIQLQVDQNNSYKTRNCSNLKKEGNWVWYPWLNSLVHVLKESDFFEVKTARNKLLINKNEQLNFYNYKIGIAGLSVGNSIATTIKLQGGAKKIKIADHDTLSLSNTNRIKAGINNLGLKKTEITRRQILEIDPYSDISVYSDGINLNNVTDFINDIDLIIDEVDDFKIKILLREQARIKKIPLLMITDNDDGALIDYYPYNYIDKVPLFYNIADTILYNFLKKETITKQEMVQLSSEIVGKSNISKRMNTSLQLIGKELYSWPQLGTAATFSGVIGCYMVRMLANGQQFNFNRKLISINNLLECY